MTQLALIEPTTPPTRNDLRAGMEKVAAAVERETPGWCGLACEALRKFAAHQGGVFNMEMARAVLAKELPPTSRTRAWGKVTVMALARGYIEPTGMYFPAASSHGSCKPVYRKGPKA